MSLLDTRRVTEANVLMVLYDRERNPTEIMEAWKLTGAGEPVWRTLQHILNGATEAGKLVLRGDGRYTVTARWALVQAMTAANTLLATAIAREEANAEDQR